MTKLVVQFSLIIFLLFNQLVYANEMQYVCGVSDGFPPYQYKSKQGQVEGFDADVMRLMADTMGAELRFYQSNWDDVVSSFVHTNKLDCVIGMEITEVRRRYFDFTIAYYDRVSAVFVLSKNTQINRFTDLIGKKVAGDRHSDLEQYLELKGLGRLIRLRQTDSKEASMKLLKSGDVLAVIAPKEVGLYLAQSLNMAVTIIEELNQVSPVGIAVKKGNTKTLNAFNEAINILNHSGQIEALYRQRFD